MTSFLFCGRSGQVVIRLRYKVMSGSCLGRTDSYEYIAGNNLYGIGFLTMAIR